MIEMWLHINSEVRITAVLGFSKIMVNLNTSWSMLFFDFCIKILQQLLLEFYVNRYGKVVLRGWSLAVAASTSVNLRWPGANSPSKNLFNCFHSPD